MRGDSLYSVGDPGRAALELAAGPPATPIGCADVELSTASLPGMLILAASSRGLEHQAAGTPRQDAFALGHRCTEDGLSEAVAVVCDGVGALSRSDRAAVLVSRRLAEFGAAGVPWADAFARANEELRKTADEPPAGDSARDGMATTAVAMSVRRQARAWVGQVAWVGDSSLWHLTKAGRWTLITGPPEDDTESAYHSAEVIPLPSADGACTQTQLSLRGGALFLMSDGVANPLRWSREVRDALAGWWAQPPSPFTFAEQVGFARKSHMDDRTVIGIWPSQGA